MLFVLIGLGSSLLGMVLSYGLPLQSLLGSSFPNLEFQLTRQLENWIGDLRVATLSPARPQYEDIIIAAVNEDTLANFPYRSPINRAFLTKLVKTLEKKGVKAIGLDIIFDQPTEKTWDNALMQAIRNAKIPVIASYADGEQLNERQQAYIDNFLKDPADRGYANVIKDPLDGIVRDIFVGRVREGTFIPGLAAALARVVGIDTPKKHTPLIYRAPPPGKKFIESFKRYPAHTISLLPAAWFKDKIVLIGAELTEIDLDLKKTPFSAALGTDAGQIPGVMIHAHALAQFLSGEQFNVTSLGLAWLVLVIMAGLGILLAKLEMPTWVSVLAWVSTLVAFWGLAFYIFAWGGPLLPMIGPTAAFLASFWIASAYVGRAERAQKKFIKGAFSRYLPPSLVDQLVNNPSMLQLRGERKELSIIFTDVAGFTSISESLPPSTLVHLLTNYMEGMCEIILRYGGTIDKFIGDAIMVLFNAPLNQDDHPQRAVNCAIELDIFSRAFKQSATDEDNKPAPFGDTRIGVHTGLATVGNFGSHQKFDYTALGDTVNAAARLESLNKQFGTFVSVSSDTVNRTHDITYRPIGSVVVKGKTEPIDILTPIHADEAQAPIVIRYNEAFELMAKGDLRARDAFGKLHEEFPDDSLVNVHYERLSKGDDVTSLMILTEK